MNILLLCIEWLIVAATAGVIFILKKLHLGVTHYNLFLTIIIVWCLLVIIAFRLLSDRKRSDSGRDPDPVGDQ